MFPQERRGRAKILPHQKDSSTLKHSFGEQVINSLQLWSIIGIITQREALREISEPTPGPLKFWQNVTEEIKSLLSRRLQEYQPDDQEARNAEDGGEREGGPNELWPGGVVHFDLSKLREG